MTFRTLYELHLNKFHYGTISAPRLPNPKFNSSRGGNHAPGLTTHMKGYLCSTELCGTCGKQIHAFDTEIDDTPNPWHQTHTPNPPYNLAKGNIYCRCGNVYDYDCRPILDSLNNIIPVESTTQQQRTSQLCSWCKSHPPTFEASLRVM